MENLQLFGCEAHAKKLEPLKKLDERNEKYIFIGYAPTGYRFWDEKRRKIKVARDVNFRERKTERERTRENCIIRLGRSSESEREEDEEDMRNGE